MSNLELALCWLLLSVIYWSPTLVGAVRQRKSIAGIAILNGYLGWTFIGWVIALVWAVVDDGERR